MATERYLGVFMGRVAVHECDRCAVLFADFDRCRSHEADCYE